MDTELSFRIILGMIFLGIGMIRIYYTAITAKSGSRFTLRQLGKVRGFLAWLLYGFIILLALVYILAPGLLTWATLPLPTVVRWTGVGMGVVSAWLLLWVHRTLGNNFATPGIIQARQTLVTAGPYHWVRHPMYTTFGLMVLALVLTTTNWFVALVGLLFGLLLRSITPTEEQTLLEKFGDSYRAYMRHTGRFLPRLAGEKP